MRPRSEYPHAWPMQPCLARPTGPVREGDGLMARALLAGVVLGLALALPVVGGRVVGFWGGFWGTFAALIGGGVALMVIYRKDARVRRAGRIIAAGALILLSSLVAYWIVWWRVPPSTLEGAWIYPLGLVSLLAGVLILRGAARTTGGTHRPGDG